MSAPSHQKILEKRGLKASYTCNSPVSRLLKNRERENYKSTGRLKYRWDG